MSFDLQRLAEEQRRENEKQNKAHTAIFKKTRGRVISFYVAGGTAIALLVGLAAYDPFTQSVRWGQAPNQVAAGGAPMATYTAPEWFQEHENKYPVALNAWQQTAYDPTKDNFTLANTILTAFTGQTIVIAAQVLPSTTTGYTDDGAKAYNPDGSKNLLYSLWTQENFSASVIVATERLINPVFGGWSAESRTNDLTSIRNKVADVFTGDWLISETPLPVLTDSSPVPGFTMGDGLTSNGSGWVGTVTGWTVDFNYDQATLNYSATVRVFIDYAIWKNDRTTATTTGELVLQLIPNLDAKTQTDRVLIDSATLTLGGQLDQAI